MLLPLCNKIPLYTVSPTWFSLDSKFSIETVFKPNRCDSTGKADSARFVLDWQIAETCASPGNLCLTSGPRP